MTASAATRPHRLRKFWPIGLIGAVAALMMLINLAIRSYAQEVMLPRYCSNVARTLDHLGRILALPRPAADPERREYLIAAKLLFLLPQQAGEPDDAYLARIRADLHEQCR